jgi:soluble lytic murein transglycosylase
VNGQILVGIFVLLLAAPELISCAPDASFPETASEEQDTARQVSDRAAGVAAARRGSELEAAGRYAEAVASFDEAARKIPQIADWLNVFAAASVSHTGDTIEVARRLQNADSVLVADWTWRTRTRAFEKAGQPARALAIATNATSSGTAGKRAAAWLAIAELQGNLGNTVARRAALLRTIEVGPSTDAATDAARLLVTFADLKAAERLQVGRVLLRNGEPSRGITELRTFIGETSDAELRNDVRYEVGRTMFNLGRYADAEQQLAKVAAGHARAADARFLIGRARYRQDKVKSGTAAFRAVTSDYPQSQAATRALFFLGDLAQDDGRTTEALRYFNQAGARQRYGGNDPALAMMRAGAIHFARKNYDDAQRSFELYRERYPKGAAYEQATFWLAQVAAARGNKDAATRLFESVDAGRSFSYYDIRSAQLLERDVLRDLPAGPARDTVRDEQIERALDRYALLREIGWNDASSFELTKLKRTAGAKSLKLYAIAEGLVNRDHANIAIGIGRELVQQGEGWNTRLMRILYPLPYFGIIKREAAARNLDPFFVAALIRQESWFNTRAVSGPGAVGLMQVMPATARQMARNATRDSLMTPALNIRLGTEFLADQVDQYNKRLDAVLAAYNAGPSRMARWRKFPEFAQPDLFAERIPFDETRDYVKVVSANTAIYRALYGDD